MKKPPLVICLILTSLFYSAVSFAQNPQIISTRTIGGSNDENLIKVVRIADKGLLLLGTTSSCDGTISNYKGKDDVFITLIDYQGNIKWTKTWGGGLNEKPIDAFFAPDANIIYVLIETQSKDGDAAFKPNNNILTVLMKIKSDGAVLDNAITDMIASNANPLNSGIKMVHDDDYVPLILRKVYNAQTHGFNRTEIASTDIANYEEGTFPILSQQFSIFPDPADSSGFFYTSDFLKYENGYNKIDGFFLFGTTSNPKIKTPPYSYFSKKGIETEVLSGFHKSPILNTDACIIRTIGDHYYKIKYEGSKCLGGKGNERAVKIFNAGNLNYRCIISSDSKDGDFKINHGMNDIWVVDITNDLKVKNKINIGTSLNDEFISEATYAEDHSAILTISGNLKTNPRTTNSYLNAANDSSGLKLTLINKAGIQESISFNLDDKNAKIFSTFGSNLLLISTVQETKTLAVISIEKYTGRILWEKTFAEYQYNSIINMHEIVDGIYCLIGNASPKLNSASNNQTDVFFTIISSNPDKFRPSTKFNDNLLDRADSDSIKNQTALNKTRLLALTVFNNDTTSIEPLWKFALISEYLADYELAYKAYATIISKINKEKDRTSFSKAMAHQITCKFLMQSEKTEKKVVPPDINESGDGFYGIGINYHVLNNHLMVATITPDKGANKAGLKACDEIVKINGTDIHNDCLTNDKVGEKLKGDKGTSVNLSVKRFGEKKLLSFAVNRSFIPNPVKTTQSKNNSTISQTVASKTSTLNQKQEQKQNFLQKVVTALQNDTSLMKQIETAKKINYALTIINKWSNEPIDKNFLLQIDEQLGMVSSIVNLAKGKNININTDGSGKISFGDPALKQIANYDYAKDAQSKFDSLAKTQPYNEVKIDKNITFVEKGNNKYESYSGYYECVESSNSQNYSNERIKFQSCPQGESARRFKVADDSPCEEEIQSSYHKIKIEGNKIYLSFRQEMKFLPCNISTNNAGAYYNGSSTGGYTNMSSESVGEIDFATMNVLFNGSTKTDVDMGKTTTSYGYGSQGKTYQVPTQGPSSTTRNYNFSGKIEFLPNYQIKITNSENQQWSLKKKVKDL